MAAGERTPDRVHVVADERMPPGTAVMVGADGTVHTIRNIGAESAPPNGCAVCNALERGHDGSHDYAPPADTLRLLRMKTRRETRLNPPPPATAHPDAYVTLTVRDGDFIDALQYALGALPPRPPELAADRFRGIVAQRLGEGRALAVGTPGPHGEGLYDRYREALETLQFPNYIDYPPPSPSPFDPIGNYEVTFDSTHMDAFDMERTIRARCRCSLTPAGVDVGFAALRTSGDFLVDSGDGPAGSAVDPELEAARHWTEHGSVCAHVCGGGADHGCDARASTSLRFTLPSGGTRELPLCGPCARAENDAPEVAS